METTVGRKCLDITPHNYGALTTRLNGYGGAVLDPQQRTTRQRGGSNFDLARVTTAAAHSHEPEKQLLSIHGTHTNEITLLFPAMISIRGNTKSFPRLPEQERMIPSPRPLPNYQLFEPHRPSCDDKMK